MLSGWLFDCYALADKLVFWIKQYNGTSVRLEDKNWSASIYVASDDNSDLYSILNTNDEKIISLIKDHEFISRYEKITDDRKQDILKLTLSDSTKASILARRIEKLCARGNIFDKLRFYNVDLPPEQSYFYEHDVFPLAFSKVGNNYNRLHGPKLNWVLKDNVWSTDYKVPQFRSIYLKVKLRKEGKIQRYSDRIGSVILSKNNKQDKGSSQSIEIESESEVDIIEELKTEITRKIDPDFIFTHDGDSFTFPYLIHRAEQNGTALILGREPTISLKRHYKEGNSYSSYGKIYFKPTTVRLFGRIHFDTNNSFILNDSGLEGLYEIARICRMSLHNAARASIGKCLSSLQFYYATQKEILIPWKPDLAEHFKTFEDLLVADRGGFIFEPEIGVHEHVAEFDFVSLYPNIMLKKNLSAETIRCNCCPDSKARVPELHYNICEKRTGIVPTSLRIVLEKRAKYKKLLKTMKTIDPQLKEIYDARQNSLKWILVTSFGYLGFNNAKFGRIDAHIAVCAFDRQILLQTVKIAERHGFRVLHGIVDSIWVKKRDDPVTTTSTPTLVSSGCYDNNNYLKLKEVLEQKVGFAISFEGIYKWVVFLNSKINYQLPVANRYFGAFEDGCLKIRGIEARRHDTPPIFYKCQNEILELMASGNNFKEVRKSIPVIKAIFHKYVRLLKENKVTFEELIFTKRISKNSNEYQDRNTIENSAITNLTYEGRSLKAGEALQYMIVDYYQKHSSKLEKRAIPAELTVNKTTDAVNYDVQRYTELLADCCNSVTKPFGLTILVPK
ncbi:MAG TPA: DNA polymerase domain-containing protein [Candidatus Nitrosopolaris sp.]|nr:DNA polymerase domain-containing protein [Candidatus Nitrosopolaris sp.]